jgi:long-chain fatty acid transport protein
MRARLVLGAAFAASAAAGQAAAHEPWTYGFGSRAAAMGGAVGADVSDFSANYYNPAGLTEREGLQLGFGYFYAENDLRIGGESSGVSSSSGIMFGLVASGDIFGVPIALGIATHIPDEGLSRITALRQEVPRWELYDNRSSVIYLSANLAIRPWDFLEVGGGLSFLSATRGRFAITGDANIFLPFDSDLRHEVDVDLTSVRYPQAGVLVHLAKTASVGVVYRGETKLDLSLEGVIDASIVNYDPPIPIRYTLKAHTVQDFLPQQVVVAASWRPAPTLTINADLVWVDWSAYENPTALTSAKLEADLPPNLPIVLPRDLAPVRVVDPGFLDRVVPRLGFEWIPPDITDADGSAVVRIPVRAGYFYERSPVPDQTGETNFVDCDRHTPSLGLGVELVPLPLSLDAHAAISILPERVTLKASPADLVGDYRQSGTMVSGGATIQGLFR